MKLNLPFCLVVCAVGIISGCSENSNPLQATNPILNKLNAPVANQTVKDFVRQPALGTATNSPFSQAQPERLFQLTGSSENMFAAYLPEEEKFEVNPCNEVIITTKDNVQLHFEALSFVDENQNNVETPVEIAVQTFDSNLEFAAAHLSTETVDGNIIETGGMFNITATSNDKEVFINPAKPYELAIPIQNNQDMTNMHTYYGEQVGEQIKWVDCESGKKIASNPKRKSFGNLDKKFYLELANMNYATSNNLASWTLKETGTSWLDWIQEQDISGTELETYFSKTNHALNFKIKLGEAGDLIYLYEENEIPRNIAFELATLLERSPKLDIETIFEQRREDVCHLSLVGTYTCKSVNYTKQLVSYYEKGRKDELLDEASIGTIESIVLKVNKLGWINCDRSRQGRDKLHVLFPAVMLFKRVWLIFKDQRVALEGKIIDDEVRFENLPKSNDVYIVALGNDKDGSKMAKLKVKLGEHIEISKMHSFTFDDLEKAFE